MVREARPCSQTSRVQQFLNWQYWYKHWVSQNQQCSLQPFLGRMCKTPTVIIVLGCIFLQAIAASWACSGLSQCVGMAKVTRVRKLSGNSVLHDLCLVDLEQKWSYKLRYLHGQQQFPSGCRCKPCYFFPLQEVPRLIFVRRKLFASGRNCVCVALPEILTNSSQHNIAQWLTLCNVCIWDISVLWPENCQLHPSSNLHGRASCKGNHPLWDPQLLWCWSPWQVLQIFPSGDENFFPQFLPFLPSGRYKCQSAGSFILPSACYQAGAPLFLREQQVLVPQGLKGRKEGGDLAGAQGWGGTWQWNSVGGFMFVSWSWAQGPCCRSRNGECLIFSYFSIIPTPLPQSFPVLRG